MRDRSVKMKSPVLENNRHQIESLLRSTGREGVEDVIRYLSDNDFYSMPSSLSRHHNWEGGLAQHVIGVYDRLSSTGKNLPTESVIITSLLHDICKIRKLYKNDKGDWTERPEKDLHIKGHGSRSVRILENLGLRLTPQEKGAIRWHMGGWKIGERSKDEIRDFYANKKNELWRLLMNADRYDAAKSRSLYKKAKEKE